MGRTSVVKKCTSPVWDESFNVGPPDDRRAFIIDHCSQDARVMSGAIRGTQGGGYYSSLGAGDLSTRAIEEKHHRLTHPGTVEASPSL